MTVIVLLSLSLGLALVALYLFYKKCYRFWDELGVVHTRPTFPLGDATRSITHRLNIAESINHVYNNYRDQPFVGFWLLFRPVLLIREPEHIKNFLVRDFMACTDRGIYVNEKQEPLTAHLFAISGQKWKNMRVKITPTFTSGKMKMMYPIMQECSRHLTAALESELTHKEVVEMKEWSARFMTDNIALCAFGIEANSLKDPNAEFRYHGARILEPTVNNVLRLMINFLAPDITRIFQIRAFDKHSSKFFLNAIRETMDYREKAEIRRNDFIDLMMQLKNKGKLEDDKRETSDSSNKPITFEEAAAQAFVFFLAGFETSSATMQFALYELAKNPEIQDKLREEIDKVMNAHQGVISYEALGDLHFLNRVVNETLRMYPVVPFLQREMTQDYHLPGTKLKLPKGTQILVDVKGLHNDPVHYPLPEKFDPDRFTEEEKGKRHHYAYLPFGEGPRNCIGMRFGLIQTKLGIATMVRNFKFSVAAQTPIPMKFDPRTFVLSPEGGMPLKVTKIN